MSFGCLALSTLVAHRRRNGRNPDLAVTVVEVCVLASGVLLLLRCLGHFHSPELQSFLALVPKPLRWCMSGAEMSGKSYGLVTFAVAQPRPHYRRALGKPCLKLLRAKSFLCFAGLVQCDIPATGPQEGDHNSARNVATEPVFRLIAA